jgi:hypothetical protein
MKKSGKTEEEKGLTFPRQKSLHLRSFHSQDDLALCQFHGQVLSLQYLEC